MKSLAQLIVKIGEYEMQTECVRRVLAEQQSFEPYTAFRRLDASRCGEIYQQDIKMFLEKHGYFVTDLDASYLFRFLDSNRDGKITYPDFAKQVLPKDDVRLREQAVLRESHFIEVNGSLPLEVEWTLLRLLSGEVEHFRKLETMRKRLKLVDAKETFALIDTHTTGFINYQQLETFLNRNDQLIMRGDLMAFFRTINEECKVTLQDFTAAIRPFHPSQIMKDKERAFFSTPKKFRRHQDQSPNLRGSLYHYDVNRSASSLNPASGSFIYKTPVRAIPESAAPRPDLDKEKRQLMKKEDFDLAQLFHRCAIKNLSFTQFTQYVLPRKPPKPKPSNISSHTLQLMYRILQNQIGQ